MINESPSSAPDKAAPKVSRRQERIAREVAAVLRRTAKIKRQVLDLDLYFARIKRWRMRARTNEARTSQYERNP